MIHRENKKKITADFMLILVAIIWGSGFIASQMAIDAGMSSALIMALRFTIAALVMLPFCLRELKHIRTSDLRHGVIAGIFLFLAFYTQIWGQSLTTVSHSAFLTATNVVLVPLIVWVTSRRQPGLKTFLMAVVTLVGIGVLTIKPGSVEANFNAGDWLTLLCAFFFALHITYLGIAMRESGAMIINLLQISMAAIISIFVLIVIDPNAFKAVDLGAGLPAAIYLGIFSTCLCYLLQTAAQKYTTASKAGVLLSTEGLFGSLFSVLLGMEALTINLVLGGFIILCAVISLEVFPRKMNHSKAN
ncbi:DMT family transporter [Paenibacillus nasutitermitis]|uniref:Transporter n=1 Tax=Paenibacillus nasutitermitis TaxID=1652958 RepID=A0A917DQC4_9BACL|nr:DMT family transporter [Paenibacillus nasutitermitis]GGD59017.1 transporter [Paenibacillus nasutitermitis]